MPVRGPRPPREAGAVSAQGTQLVSRESPPHSDEAEQGLLGCVILDAERTLTSCAERRVTGACFYSPRHQLIFETAQSMQGRGEQVDLLTLISRLRDQGDLEKAGGETALMEIVDRTPTIQHASYYLTLVYDRYILRSLLDRCRDIADRCYDTSLEPREVLSEAEKDILAIRDTVPQAQRSWQELFSYNTKEIERILDDPRAITGLSTGYAKLDEMLLGLQNGEMIVLAARPSMGKTSLAMNIVENVALGFNHDTGRGKPDRAPLPVGVFSLEMSGEALVRRMLCSYSGIAWNDIVHGKLHDKQASFSAIAGAANDLMQAKVYVDDSGAIEISELRARARRMHKSHHVRLIVVDYLGLIRCAARAKEGRQQEVSAISGEIKAMAKELQIPVLVLSQLNRTPEERSNRGVPKLADLRDSGSIEQDADVVLMLRRPHRVGTTDPMYNEDMKDLAIIDVAKHRNGRTGEIRMLFDDFRTRFKDLAEGGVDSRVATGPDGDVDE
ncbi:MAG: replicative DNA helicase [Kiritimatiellae bacterium]|nr:replicative DNA helicase [Kiritimatiellia bacterium]